MTMMSAYRQAEPMLAIEHAACIEGATTEQDVELIMMALTCEKPALIGLNGHSTIIKPAVDGDEAFSFEALYDVALTQADMQRMQRANVSSPDEIPLEVLRDRPRDCL